MKMRALGTAPARPAAVPSERPPDPQPDPVRRVRVAERCAKGRPTRLELPGPLAGASAGLYARRAGGGVVWVGDVTRSGAVKTDRDWLLSAVTPGTRIVAACDPSGRVISLSALCEADGAPKPQAARAAPATTYTRTAAEQPDPYRHIPGELRYSGHLGRVISVR
jgi:hypothetical protein